MIINIFAGALLTGHSTLNRHLTLLNTEEDPMCPLCGEEYYVTGLHLLGTCCAVVGKRRKQLGKHSLVPNEFKIGALERPHEVC